MSAYRLVTHNMMFLSGALPYVNLVNHLVKQAGVLRLNHFNKSEMNEGSEQRLVLYSKQTGAWQNSSICRGYACAYLWKTDTGRNTYAQRGEYCKIILKFSAFILY